jgi:hypothetical protein
MVKPQQTQRKDNHAKKEKRITGGIPEEEPGEIQIETEIEGRIGKTESSPKAQAIRKQL